MEDEGSQNQSQVETKHLLHRCLELHSLNNIFRPQA